MPEPVAPRPLPLRPFGRTEDLELELGDRDRPALVTALLARCSEPGDEERWWALPVGERIAALLQLVALTESVDHLTVPSRCPQPSCGVAFEFALPLAALLGPTRATDATSGTAPKPGADRIVGPDSKRGAYPKPGADSKPGIDSKPGTDLTLATAASHLVDLAHVVRCGQRSVS